MWHAIRVKHDLLYQQSPNQGEPLKKKKKTPGDSKKWLTDDRKAENDRKNIHSIHKITRNPHHKITHICF